MFVCVCVRVYACMCVLSTCMHVVLCVPHSTHADLVPKSNVEEWLKHLRSEFPAIAFKASTQSQKENLVSADVPSFPVYSVPAHFTDWPVCMIVHACMCVAKYTVCGTHFDEFRM